MNEIEDLTKLCQEVKCYGFLAILIDPETGKAVQYTRLIESDIIPSMLRSVKAGKNSAMMQFYTDDAGFALLKALLERENTDDSQENSLEKRG